MMNLPEQFLENMKTLLAEDYESWLASYEQAASGGLRINTLRLDGAQWEKLSPYGTRRVPWTENGFYCDSGERPAKDAYYYAGLYYLQEPSAMVPAAVLPVKPGDRVLDLCAAPGGKSTELGARLAGEGLLVSNDISSSRARALLKNLELFGVANLCVTSEAPQKLADVFGAFFDAILVDAPCSGEGMFRRDPELIKSWLEHGPEYYVPIQREILKQAARMLRPGGYLLYSTCTFSEKEDEQNVAWLLAEEPALALVPLPRFAGACGGTGGEPVLRLFPHRLEGEGHFAALFRKDGEGSAEPGPAPGCPAAGSAHAVSPDVKRLLKESDFSEWEALLSQPFDHSRLMVKDGMVYLLPEGFAPPRGLRYLRTGLLLGEWKKNRFEPSQAAAMALGAGRFSQSHLLSLAHDDARVIRYLKGETIFPEPGETLTKGWTLVCVDGFALGWAKYTGNMLKNKYYPGWRWQ